MTDMDAAIMAWLPYARGATRKLWRPAIESGRVSNDDATSVLMEAIWRALATHNNTGKLSTHIVMTAIRRTINHLRKYGGWGRFGNYRPFQTPASQFKGNDQPALDRVSHDDGPRMIELRDEARVLLSRLSPRSQQVCTLYYLRGLTMEQVARRLRISQATVTLHLRLLKGAMKPCSYSAESSATASTSARTS